MPKPSAVSFVALASRPRLRRPKLSVLVFTDGYHVQEECIRALCALGHAAEAFPLHAPPSAASAEKTTAAETLGQRLNRLVQRVAERQVDLLISINYVGFDRAGALSRLLERLRLPLALWFVDSPLFFAMGYLPPPNTASVFCWDKTHAAALRGYGADPVYHLPLGCEPARFAAPSAAQTGAGGAARYPLGFVGSSLVPLQRRWHERLQAQEHADAEAMAERLAADRASLHALVPEPQAPIDRRTLAAAWANCAASRPYRRRLLAALPQASLHVFGDAAWRDELPGAHYGGALAYGAELAECYRACAINLNATILQMPTAVNQRVFDVPAAGGFLLTDAQAELHDLFDVAAKEAVCYSNADELAALVARYQDDPAARQAVADKGRARVLACHTYVHRLRTLLGHMRRDHGFRPQAGG